MAELVTLEAASSDANALLAESWGSDVRIGMPQAELDPSFASRLTKRNRAGTAMAP